MSRKGGPLSPKIGKITRGRLRMVPHQHLDGPVVAFQVLMPEDRGSNPEASSIYFKLTEFVLVWACFNPSGILTQPSSKNMQPNGTD